MNQTKKNIRKKSTFREYSEAIIIAIILALFIRTFVIQAFKIPSGSMEPTLRIGDHLLVNKFIYGIKLPVWRRTIVPVTTPERGDVIVFIYPVDQGKDFIKRIIGLPGERIEFLDQQLLVNGQPVEDPFGYYSEKKSTAENPDSGGRSWPVLIPEGHYFVMGDNRDHSYDSRFWGPVSSELVKGKAFIIYWSWPNWKRFLQLIK